MDGRNPNAGGSGDLGGVGARPRFRPAAPRLTQQQRQQLQQLQQRIQQQQQAQQPQPRFGPREFGDLIITRDDWRLIQGLLGPMIEQKQDICWAIMLARILEAAYNLFMDNPLDYLQISVQDLVDKMKAGESDKMMYSLKKAIKFIISEGIAKVATTSNAHPSRIKRIRWRFGFNLNADAEFITQKLASCPVGIIIDIDDEFRQLRGGVYRIRAVPPNAQGKVIRHALTLMARGIRTADGQEFFICENSWEKTWGVDGYGRLIIEGDMTCVAIFSLGPV